MEFLKYVAPEGTAWELLLSVAVLIAAPILVERVRIPGLIGLLAGGCIIGPNVLDVVSSHDGVVHSLGELGLLYLMFVAGITLLTGLLIPETRELDLDRPDTGRLSNAPSAPQFR